MKTMRRYVLRLLGVRCPNVVGPVWKAGGESWACVLPFKHRGDHQGGDGTLWA